MGTIYIYDEIGDPAWGLIGAKTVADELDSFDGADVLVRINSPGGSVFEALAIRELFTDYAGSIAVKIDALAASAASFLAPTGSHVSMAPQARMMIHSPWTMMAGNAESLREAANMLDTVEGDLLNIYLERFSGDRSQLRDMLRAETILNAAEALAAGFVDEITVGERAVAACWRSGLSSKLDELYRDEATIDPSRTRKQKASRKARTGVTDFERDRLRRVSSPDFWELRKG